MNHVNLNIHGAAFVGNITATVILDWCGERIPPCQPTYRDSGGTVICCHCDVNAYMCYDCGIFIPSGAVYWVGDDSLCSECYNASSDNHSDIIFEYSFKPVFHFYGSGPVYFGVELEIDDGENREACARAIDKVANIEKWKIYTKNDSSLHCGLEIVSMPATLDSHLSIFPWLQIMEIALNYGFRSHNTSTCGLHVHINRTAFGTNLVQREFGIAKLTYLVELFWNELVIFSRRTDEQLGQWAKSYGLNTNYEDPDSLYKKACKDNESGRYYAVNLQNQETIELRMFRGTLKYSTLTATLQLIQLLVDIANELGIEQIQTLTWPQLIHAGAKYNELQEYLYVRRLI